MAKRNSRNRPKSTLNAGKSTFDQKSNKSFLDNINDIEDIEQIFNDKKLKTQIYHMMKRDGLQNDMLMAHTI